jgi:hypothetical protein
MIDSKIKIKKFYESLDDIYFVYCFLDTRKPGEYIFEDYKFEFEPIYIGKGKGIRPQRHFTLYKRYNTRFYSKMNSIISSGNKPEFILLSSGLTEKESFEFEKFFIKIIGRIENGGTLTNLSDGGEGQSGFRHSEKTKKKMSEVRKCKKLKPLSDEAKLKISISKIGKPSKLKGISFDDLYGEEKSNLIKSKMSNAGLKRIGEKNPMFGKNHTEYTKQKISQNQVRRFGESNPNFGREYKEEEKTFDTWRLTNINGEEHIINNLNKFCLDNNLNPSCMRDIYYGRMKKHKDWIKVEKLTDNVKKKTPK